MRFTVIQIHMKMNVSFSDTLLFFMIGCKQIADYNSAEASNSDAENPNSVAKNPEEETNHESPKQKINNSK